MSQEPVPLDPPGCTSSSTGCPLTNYATMAGQIDTAFDGQLESLLFSNDRGKRNFDAFDTIDTFSLPSNSPPDNSDKGASGPEPRRAGRKLDPHEPESKRRAQNRAAQRAFRERKERHLKDLETRVQELEQSSRSWQNSNLMLRSKLSSLEQELEGYRSGRIGARPVPSQLPHPAALPGTAPGTVRGALPGTLPGVAPIPGTGYAPLPAASNWTKDLQGPATVLPGPTVPASLGLHGPATVFPELSELLRFPAVSPADTLPRGRSGAPASDAGSVGPATVSPAALPNGLSPLGEYQGGVQGGVQANSLISPADTPGRTTSSNSSRKVPVAPGLGQYESPASASSASQGDEFCDELSRIACPTPRALKPGAPEIKPQIASTTPAPWQEPPIEFSFGYRDPSQIDNPLELPELVNSDYGFFDPLDDPLAGMDNFNESGANGFLGGPLAEPIAPLDATTTANDLFDISKDPEDFGSLVASKPEVPETSLPARDTALLQASQEVKQAKAAKAAQKSSEAKSEEVPAPKEKYMSCSAVWDRICAHPNFDGIDINDLCSELQSKARCSDSGVVLTEKDVDSALLKTKAGRKMSPFKF